jgi:hypothetical protein
MSRFSAMGRKIEQHICIKFCVKLGKSPTETLDMLREAFGEYYLSRMPVFEWHSRFKAGRVSVEGDERSRRTSTGKAQKMLKKFKNTSRRPSPNNP